MDLVLLQVAKSAVLLIVLLNPFLLSIYLLDLIEGLENRVFNATLVRGATIATSVFILFAAGGDAIFSEVLQVRFASFLVFGGVLFLIIAIRFMQTGPDAFQQLRGKPEHIAGSIAMPFMVGPGTVSASVLAGARLPIGWAVVAILCAMVAVVLSLSILKWLHTRLRETKAALVDRYVDIVGRVSALLIGTIAVDMIFNGIELWMAQHSRIAQ